MTHNKNQNKENNDAKDPDENGIPKGYVQGNVTDRPVILKQYGHILIYVLGYNKLI